MQNGNKTGFVRSNLSHSQPFSLIFPMNFLCGAKRLIKPTEVGLFRPSESVSKDKPRSGASPLLGLVTRLPNFDLGEERQTHSMCLLLARRSPQNTNAERPSTHTNTHTNYADCNSLGPALCLSDARLSALSAADRINRSN